MERSDETGLVTARRMLDAMAGRDVETRRSLWRAAKRYAAKSRGEARTGINAPPLAALGMGGL